MSVILVDTLWQCITQIEAQNLLCQMSVVDWPNMKKQDREKRHKELFSMAYPKHMIPKNKITVEDLQKLLKG